MENADKYPIDEAFLIRYFVQATDEAENRQVEAWRLQNPQNQKKFSDLQKIWDTSGQVNFDYPPVNVDLAWTKLKNKIANPPKTETKVIPLKSSSQSKSTLKVWQVAAGLALVVGFAWVFLLMNQSNQSEVFATNTKTSSLNLPDGTKVFLNKNSKINYPKKFAGKVREVEFSGEAYFEVRANPQQPFQIKTEHFRVEVLGTAFNLQADATQNALIVQEGKVKVSNSQGSIELIAGEKVIFDTKTQTLQKLKNQDLNFLAYKTKVLIFKEIPLAEALRQIEDLYQTKITLANPNLKNCKLTVNFENKDLETILKIITDTLELKMERKGEEIILDGEGCE